TDLVTGDVNSTADVFLHDRLLGTTTLMSTTSAGVKVVKGGTGACLSGDGKKLSFASESGLLAPGDMNGKFDIFVKDVATGAVALASVNKDGTGSGDDQSGPGVLDGDGNLVAFVSRADNIVANDTNQTADVFLRDMAAGVNERISVASDGTQGDGAS